MKIVKIFAKHPRFAKKYFPHVPVEYTGEPWGPWAGIVYFEGEDGALYKGELPEYAGCGGPNEPIANTAWRFLSQGRARLDYKRRLTEEEAAEIQRSVPPA